MDDALFDPADATRSMAILEWHTWCLNWDRHPEHRPIFTPVGLRLRAVLRRVRASEDTLRALLDLDSKLPRTDLAEAEGMVRGAIERVRRASDALDTQGEAIWDADLVITDLVEAIGCVLDAHGPGHRLVADAVGIVDEHAELLAPGVSTAREMMAAMRPDVELPVRLLLRSVISAAEVASEIATGRWALLQDEAVQTRGLDNAPCFGSRTCSEAPTNCVPPQRARQTRSPTTISTRPS